MAMRREIGSAARVAIFLAFGVCRLAVALDPDLSITQYVHSVWRAPQALPHDNVSAILQTRDGYLWIGTVEGLARFDGVRSVKYDKSNTPAIANNWIRDLTEDREGRLWIATFGGGLVCRKEGSFLRYGTRHGLSADTINVVFVDSKGRIWVGAASGLFRFQNERFIRQVGEESTTPENVRAIAEDHKGFLWIGTESGLFRMDEGGDKILTRQEGLSDDKIFSLAVDRLGLWIGTEKNGLNRLVGDHISTITTKDGLTHERIWSLEIDSNENLWIGTDGGGLNRLARGRLTSFTSKNGLANDYVWAIHEDRERNLWVGTNGGGLNCLKDGSVIPITTQEGLPSDFVWTILGARNGAMWVGTEDAGLVRIQNGTVTTYTTRDGLTTNGKVLLEDDNGTVLVGGQHGINLWKEGRVLPFPGSGLDQDRITGLVGSLEKGLWIGTGSDGLKYWKNGKIRTYTKDNGLTSNNITCLHKARDGSLWIGTLVGLNHFSDGNFASWTRSDGLPSDYVASIFEGPDGSIWGGTRGGIFRVRSGKIQKVTSKEGLFDDAVMSVLVSDDGYVWMGGNRGLHCSNWRDLDEVFQGHRQRVRSKSLGLDDGMRSLEVNGSGSSAWKAPDGRLYFATRGGIAVIDTARLVRNTVEPPVLIEQILVDGEPWKDPQSHEFPAGTRRLEIQFTALSFVSPSSVRFKQRLDGFDPDWVDTKHRSAGYTNLPPGPYSFRVVAANNDDVWNTKGATLNFVIAPYFYETLWFRIILVLTFLLVGPLFYLIRVRRLRGQKAELERLVAERTAEVQAANEQLAQLAREDPLTGVANRRRLDEALDEEWRRAYRMNTSLTLLLADVDFFKDYNDHLGHIAGDECLQKIARTVANAHTRAGELVARYGGEEFAVLIPGITKEKSEWSAEDLRGRILELAIPHPSSAVARIVTVSVGAAWMEPSSGISAADLMESADNALYRAKRSGRNRVETSFLTSKQD